MDNTTVLSSPASELETKAQDAKPTVSPDSEQKVVVEPTVIDASSSMKASSSEAPAAPVAPVVPAVDTSLSALEARCKRFGIPFDASKLNANPKPAELAMAKKGTAEKATTKKVTAEKKTNERANALEERRKRFGMPPAEEKEKEEKKSLPSMHRLRDCSAEERKVLEARMKRFGLM